MLLARLCIARGLAHSAFTFTSNADAIVYRLKPLKGRPRVAPYDLARDAQKWVAKIRRENGGVSREVEAGMKRDYPEAWEVLQTVRRKLGSAAKT